MLTPEGKYQILVIDNLTQAQAKRVVTSLVNYFKGYEFLNLYQGKQQYLVVARGDITDECLNRMIWFATGVIYGMEKNND